MINTIPAKLVKGDKIRVIAPSRSLSLISEETRNIAKKRFEELGLVLSFGKYVEENDDFVSSSIESRVEDLHDAFADSSVKAVITVIGGFNSNQLLDYIDWDLVEKNPKIFCGFSDITILNNAFLTKTGLVTYSGPHYSSFGQKLHFEYTLEYFKKCLMEEQPFLLIPAPQWSDDEWYLNQDNRKLIPNTGYFLIHEGNAEGIIIGGNLNTLNLLQGTAYMPDLKETILFIEDDYDSAPHTFDRYLQSLIQQSNFNQVRGIVIGRFQHKSNMTNNLLKQIIETKKELKTIPVVANVNFGHTDPKVTVPIGGTVKINVSRENTKIEIIRH